ncbi:MAG: hypothetical protein RRA51_06775, partial [Armatimonadota bacterium]|nr:hypothetical protein [Armatimonadota bacterium]
ASTFLLCQGLSGIFSSSTSNSTAVLTIAKAPPERRKSLPAGNNFSSTDGSVEETFGQDGYVQKLLLPLASVSG